MTSDSLTRITVTFMGGPHDGDTKKISVPLGDEAAGKVRIQSVAYRVRRGDGRILLVHPSAQGLYSWPT